MSEGEIAEQPVSLAGRINIVVRLEQVALSNTSQATEEGPKLRVRDQSDL